MNPQQLEDFRTALLSVLAERASERFGLRRPGITIFLAQYGFNQASVADTNAELLYLKDKGFVVEVSKVLSPENAAWRITAAGRDFLAQQKSE